MEKREQAQPCYINQVIPRLHSLRRIPEMYRRMFPLSMVRRYQCVAIGKAGGVITVAITDPACTQMLRRLETLTGYSFFPVLVDAERLKLLIRRMERSEVRKNPLLALHPTPSSQVHSMLVLLLALHQHIASA